MSSIWDDPDLRASGEFVKFDNVGDKVAGTITAIRAHRWDDGSVSPQILLVTDEGEEKSITAGQVKLKALLAEQRPESGDHITIAFTENEKRAGGKTLKHFTLEVKRGGGQPTAAPAAPAVTAPAQPDPAALAAALGNLSAEQKAALGIPA